MQKKLQNRKNIIRYLDTAHSWAVRLEHTDAWRQTKCYTCDRLLDIQYQAQCGHFRKRGDSTVRYDFNNCRVQCSGCNSNLGGNLKEFEKRLRAEIGDTKVAIVIRESHRTKKWSDSELYALLQERRVYCKQLSKLRGIPLPSYV